YELFGGRNGKITVWPADEVCKIIGYVEEDGEPSQNQIKNIRRTRQKLVEEGILEKASERIRADVVLYGWRYVPQDAMDQQALALLNARSSITWCNAGDRLRLMVAEKLDTLP